MSDAFDPYHKWLAIPANEQPANHYRLLAVALFEGDLDVIEAAANQRMAHVRTYQTGKHSALSQKLLNELSAARICLLNPTQHAAYDARLRQQLTVAAAAEAAPAASRSHVKRGTARARQTIGIAAALAAVVLIIIWIASSSPKQQGTQLVQAVESPTAADPRHDEPTPVAAQQVEKREPHREVQPPPPPSGGDSGLAPANDSSETPDPPPGEIESAATTPNGEANTAGAPPSQPAQTTEQSPAAASELAAAPPDGTRPPTATAEPQARPASRAAMPDAEALAKAEALIRETYKDDLAGDDQLKTARSLLSAVDETSVAAERAALVLMAADLAAGVAEYSIACTAYDELARLFDFDALEAKTKLMENAAKLARMGSECASVAKSALDLLDEAAREGRFDAADRLGKVAQAAALRTKDVKLRKEIAARRGDLKKRRSGHAAREKAFADAHRVLAEHPDDPPANETVGKQLCFDKNDWVLGLKHLTKAPAGKLRDAAVADVKGAADAEQQIKIGDLWWELSEADQRANSPACRRRAAFWYAQGLTGVAGLLKTRTEKRLEGLGDVDLAGQSSGDANIQTLLLAPGVPLVLVKVPPSADGAVRGFWLGQTEVTQRQWSAMMGAFPAPQPEDSGALPVVFVRFDDCNRFTEALNDKIGSSAGRFRLPTKEEFAYCLAGGPAEWNDFQREPTKYGWFKEESSGQPHVAARKQRSLFGVYDLLGNVWEWTSDCRYYGMSAADSSADNASLEMALSSVPPPKNESYKTYRGWNLGFRVATNWGP